MKRLLAVGAVSILGALMIGSAAALNVTGGDSLGAGDIVVVSCDLDGVIITYTTALYDPAGAPTQYVTGATVNVNGIDDGNCTNITVHLTDGTATPLLSVGPTLVTGVNMSFGPVPATALTDVHVILE